MIQCLTGALVVVLLAMPILAGAQTAAVKHPDFTGTWKVSNIELPQAPAGGFAGGDRGFGGGGRGAGGRGRRGGGGGGGNGGGGNSGNATGDNGDRADRPLRPEVGQTVRVRQTDTQLIVTEQAADGGVMNRYTLDGKETTNTTNNAITKSKSKWDGVALVTDSTRTMDTERGKFSMKSREVRSLSEDGMTMIVRSELDTPRGKQTTTVTYSKVED